MSKTKAKTDPRLDLVQRFITETLEDGRDDVVRDAFNALLQASGGLESLDLPLIRKIFTLIFNEPSIDDNRSAEQRRDAMAEFAEGEHAAHCTCCAKRNAKTGQFARAA